VELTLGVEEEFLLVDPVTAGAVPRAAATLDVVDRPALSPGATVHGELRPTQVESATGICVTAEELLGQLRTGRTLLRDAAKQHGAVLLATGTPVAPASEVDSAPRAARFARIDGRFAGIVSDYEACGCHVHVGVADRDTAIAVCNHLSHWLPTLLALSANSPFDGDRHTGYASWRMVQQSRFPGSGLPPHFEDYAGYQAAVGRLVDAGVLIDDAMTFWLVRPSRTLPTVELRVADTAVTARESLVYALIARALVRRALSDVDKGVTARPIDPQLAAASVWAAARYGLAGNGIDPMSGQARSALALLDELEHHIRPFLDSDEPIVTAGLAAIRRSGTGAQRQLAAATQGKLLDLLSTG
jgi:carboxylate-amine ligase